MHHKKAWLFILIILFIYGAYAAYQRLVWCYAYHKIISWHPEALLNLSGELSEVEILSENNAPILSIGYAQVAIEPKEIEKIELGAHNSVMVHCTDWKCSFLTPLGPPQEPLISPYSYQEIRTTISDEDLLSYEFYFKGAKAMPKSYWEIFFMRPRAFQEYLMFSVYKSFGNYNQNGIGAFETENIKGLVHFGKKNEPQRIVAYVFSKKSNISQGVHVSSEDAQKSKDMLFSLLQSYNILIDELPDENSLQELILSEISTHDKFVEEREDLVGTGELSTSLH